MTRLTSKQAATMRTAQMNLRIALAREKVKPGENLARIEWCRAKIAELKAIQSTREVEE